MAMARRKSTTPVKGTAGGRPDYNYSSQAIHISQRAYLNAFGTDGKRY
jgi:hypothetical protein